MMSPPCSDQLPPSIPINPRPRFRDDVARLCGDGGSLRWLCVGSAFWLWPRSGLMPAGRVSMRYMREILRLGSAGISKHEIARRTGLAPSTVRETLKRFEVAGLVWPLPDDVMDATLEARLYKNAGTKQGYRR